MKSFFKVIGIIIWSIIGLILIIILWYYIADKIQKSIEVKVNITISYDTVGCKPEYPLHINIFNWTNKIILNTNLDIWVYQPEYSSNIIAYSNYDYNINTDKIIQSDWSYDFCHIIPTLTKNDVDVRNLIYNISSKDIRFQK